MILTQTFWVPVEEDLYSKFTEILKQEYGLVEPNGPPWKGHVTNLGNCLVWEDSQRIGRYKVHSYCGKANEREFDHFLFTYFQHRVTLEILDSDPMREVVKRLLSEAKKPQELEHLTCEVSLEELS